MPKMLLIILLCSLVVASCATLPAESALQPPDEGNVVEDSGQELPPPGETSPGEARGDDPDQAPGREQDTESHPVLGAEEVWGTPGAPVDDPKVELPEGVVIRFTRSGGFAGLDEEWLIYADGKIGRGENSWQVAPEVVESTLAQIEEAGFFTAQASKSPGLAGADRMAFSLSVEYKGFRRTLSGVEGGSGTPQAFWEAVNAVQALLLGAVQ